MAEACGDTVILNLANNPTYSPSTPETILVGADQCEILSAVHNAVQVTITTHAEFQNAHTYLEIVVTPGTSDIHIDSWQEIATSP